MSSVIQTANIPNNALIVVVQQIINHIRRRQTLRTTFNIMRNYRRPPQT